MTGRLVGLAALVVAVHSAAAQGDCFPPASSNEARTLAIFAVPLAFGPFGGAALDGGRVQVGFELSHLPRVDAATATPTVCRPGKGPENTDLLFAAPRPRIAVGLGGGFTVEGAWTPPIRLNGVRANLFAVALGYQTPLGRSRARLSLRGHATFGRVNAPITCPDDQLANPVSECYGGTRSDDRYRPNIVGVDAAVRWPGRLEPYLGTGYNRLMPRFQVDFVNAQQQHDERRVTVDLDRLAVFGGVVFHPDRRWAVVGELYSTPADAVTVRTGLRLGL